MHRSLPLLLLLSGLSLASAPAFGAPADALEPPAPVTLETVTVSGVLPGPGLWKVSKGEHVLWILASLSPLPKRMAWESLMVERTLARSQELILPPSVFVNADIGFFGALMLAPKALGARKIPDDGQLQSILPAELYARWTTLKVRYLGRDRGVERWRPLFAANKLYNEALSDHGLRRSSDVVPVLRKRAEKLELKITSPMVKRTIADPKAALNKFIASELDDLACFEKTLDRLEHDLDKMRARANAWAIGDIQTLQALPYEDQDESCLQAVMDSEVASELGFGALEPQVRDQWLKAAEAALTNNASTVAIVTLDELLPADGYLSLLQARGYAVEAPQ